MGEVLISKCSSVTECQIDPVCDGSLAGLLVTSYQLAHGQQPLCPISHIELHSADEENTLLCFQVQGFWICSFHTSQVPFMKWASISGIQDRHCIANVVYIVLFKQN